MLSCLMLSFVEMPQANHGKMNFMRSSSFFLCINKHRPATCECEQGGALFVCSMKSFERFAQDF